MNNNQYCNAEFLLQKIQESDAVLVGAASGLSAADGKHFWYQDDNEFKEFSKASETNMGFVLLLMLSIIHIKRQMKDGLPLPLWFIIFMNLKLARFIRT